MPPLFALGVLRIDSPAAHSQEVYAWDKEFFSLHKARKLYLRNGYVGEFDIEPDVSEWLRIPHLQVLVNQLAPGIHQVTPVYRGRSFFSNNDGTDLEVMQIVIEMGRRNGIDEIEWLAYEQNHHKRLNAAQAGQNEVAQ